MTSNFYVDFLYFITYSILGWMCEVVFCSFLAKKFINRGFLNGPLCPIYGFGAIIVITALTPFRNNIFLVFILGLIFTSTLEYITSFVMEKLFHSKWWDYSQNKFNINGRVCLLNSIMFGLLSVFVMFVLHVEVEKVISSISYLWIQIIAVTTIIILTVDVTVTVQTVIDLNEKMSKLRELSSEIKEKFSEVHVYVEDKIFDKIESLKDSLDGLEHGSELYSKVERLVKEFSQTAKSSKVFQRRLIHAFPELKSNKFQNQLQSIRNNIDRKRIKSRK